MLQDAELCISSFPICLFLNLMLSYAVGHKSHFWSDLIPSPSKFHQRIQRFIITIPADHVNNIVYNTSLDDLHHLGHCALFKEDIFIKMINQHLNCSWKNILFTINNMKSCISIKWKLLNKSFHVRKKKVVDHKMSFEVVLIYWITFSALGGDRMISQITQ